MENSYYDLEKARVVKYIKRIPKPSGKGYYYFYTKEQLKAYYEKGIVPEGQTKEEEPIKQSPFASIMDFFGLGSPKEAQQKIKAEYETNQIKSIFDISVYMFSDYMNAYFKHKEKFDAFFKAKEKTESGTGSGSEPGKSVGASGDKKPDAKVTTKTITVDGQTYQLDVMKFISQKYGSMKKEKQSGKNRPDVRPGSVSADSTPVQPGAAEGYVAGDVQERQPTSDSRQSVFPSGDTGVGPAEHVSDRVSKKAAKDIRQACLDLLASKTDDQMTGEDKDLLRMYEGAGGLHEENSSTHGTLYEFYTPTAVVNKMWDIVRKYISGWNKPGNELSVLEPSAGTGRFMEAGNYQYDAVEIDETSARINKILHPEASVVQGGFQEMFFKDGVLQREYNGKKYDVVIGNPPYGSYEGIYKGRGEGKDHSRYEEYFIDRGLDTLKDGGIMAFIVPSGFLRSGKNSAIKEKIAKKGRLMEAWRLPNGTFSSTGVGTDILIIRKEKGNINDFLMDGFFKDNPDNVLGEEVMKSGRFGQEKYIQLKPGESFDQAIQAIDTVKHEVVAPRELPMTEHQKRSIATAMKGNKNAKKDGPLAEKKQSESAPGAKKETQTAEQFNAQYNMSFKTYELDAWKNTNFDGSLNLDGIPTKSLDQLRKDGDIFYMSGKYYHKTNYLSGNIYKKLDALDTDRATGKVTDAEYKRQKKELESKIPSPKTVKNISVSPLSQFAKDFYFREDIEDDTDMEIIPIPPELDGLAEIARVGSWQVSKRTAMDAKLPKEVIDAFQQTYGGGDEGWRKFVAAAKRTRGSLSSSLMERFWEWAGGNQSGGKYRQTFDAGVSRGDLPLNAGWSDIVDYIEGVPTRTKANASDAEKDRTQRIREERRAAAEKIFNKFIQTGLTESERKYFEGEWNRIFNANVDPDFKKVPVFLDGIATTFKDKKLEVKDIQLKGISFLGNKGNGLLAYDVGVGKAQPLDAKILTPNGWTTMGEVKTGDFVIAADGKPAKVVGVYPQGRKEIFRVSFSDGSSTECCNEHLWAVQLPWSRNKAQSKGKNKWTVKSLEEISENIKNSRGERVYSIPMTKPVEMNKRELLIKPYLMGIILGDGGIGKASVVISSADKEIVNRVSEELPKDVFLKKIENSNCDYRITTGENGGIRFNKNSILQSLRKYGLSGKKSDTKFIPEDYKYGSAEDRIELLRGLMDSDGYVDGRGVVIQFGTTSVDLALDVSDIVMSLGGTVKFTSKEPKFTYKGESKTGKTAYSLTISLPESINPFFLKRKRDRVKGKTKYKPVRYIDAIDFVGMKEAQCISIDHPSHLYITDDYIVTHNTLTGILATVQQLQLGRAKRPLICVPKGVYKNWIKEIQDLFPDIKINALGNLGKDAESSVKMVDGKPVIEDGALNIVTYEALANLTFKDDTINSGLLNDIVESQETEGEGDSDRDRAKKKEKIMTKLGSATDVKSKAYYIEDFGFDHITVDEVHNFKNIFTAPTPPKGGRMRGGFENKNDTNKKQANEFQGIGAGAESKRGLKMFAVAQYIQSVSNGRNVFALSATPFQNSPVEIYNILSLVARDRLKDLGIFNMYEFMTQFAELKSEWSVTAKGQIERKQVMKEFKNLSALQNLITEYIDKVDGVEAGVKRPEKTTHLIQLPMNDVQKDIMAVETRRMESASNDNPGAVLKGINNCRQSTISPAEIKEDSFHTGIDIRKMRYVEDSPKLTFTFDSVTAIHKDAPSVGQVVYMPRGVTNYDKCVDYLVKKGIPKDAIATISAGIALDKRESIMESFNDPRGKIKVIIGSESIQEGVNLNGNSAILYNTLLDWNPTESLQVEGRIWRQGNKQSNVHIVYPLLADSIDSSMYQKHDEKSKRLASLFSYKGDTLNVEGINAEEVKFDLIKNPEKRAKFQIDLEKESAQNRVRDYQLSIENLEKMERDYHGASTKNQDYYRERIAETEAEMAEMKADIAAAKKEVEEATGDYDKRFANIKLDREESSYRYKQSKAAEFKKELNRAIELKARIEFNLSQMGLNFEGVPAEVEKRKAEMEQIQQEIKDIEAKMPEYIEAAKRDIIEKASMKVPTVSESVKNFVQSVSGTIIKKVEDLEKSFTIRNGKVLIRKFNPETAQYEYIRG
jgi:hypothetical protein